MASSKYRREEEAKLKRQYDSQTSSLPQSPPTENKSFIGSLLAFFSKWWPTRQGSPPDNVEGVVAIYKQAYRSFNLEEQTHLICRMSEELSQQIMENATQRKDEAEQVKQEMELFRQQDALLRQELDRYAKHNRKEGEMSGKRVVLAEQENLDAIINDYFDDDLQTFVNTFKGDVLQMEYKINKCLTKAFEQARNDLVQEIVRLFESETAGPAASRYRKMAGKMNPRDVLMKFLSADVYANALKVDHKLSHPDQELRSEAIYLKSAFLKDSARQRSCMASMDKVIRNHFAHLPTKAETGDFLAATVTLIQQMLMSKGPVIPWTGLETFDAMYVKADPVGAGHKPAKPQEMKGLKFDGFREPIMLFCNDRSVKVRKGVVVIQ